MPTSYTSLLGLALPVTGELSGTWGDTVNQYITQYVDAAVAGAQTISGSQTAVTLSVTNGSSLTQAGAGATGSAQYQIINCTGNPASALTVTVPSASKVYLVLNNTSTNQTVTVKGAATTGVTVAAARCALIAWNGTDFELVATDDASKMNGVLAAVNGGTGQSSYAVGDILYASTTTALSKLADVATGNALISGGVGVAPSYGKIGLTTHVSGTLPVANGGTGLTSGTSGGVLGFTATGTIASSAALAANAIVIGGGAGATPTTTTTGTGVVTAIGNAVNTTGGLVTQSGTLAASSLLLGGGASTAISSTTTGTGVVTALGTAVGSAGAFVVNGGALGTPSSGTVTNLTGTASININGTVGATTPNTGAFTSVTSTSASGILTRAAASQDGVELIGRAGGTLSYKVSITPTTLTASRTVTLPDANIDFTTGLAVANGGTGSTTASGARTNLGATTVGGNFFTLTNPSAITFPRINADNTVSALDAATFRTAIGAGTGAGSVTSVAQTFTGGLISVSGSPVTGSGTLALTVAGTSGGIPYFSSASTWATSAALAANSLVIGGGAGVAPSTTTTGTGVLTALGTNVGSAGAFVVNGGALGTPSSGTVTNLTGTASININGTVGATTPNTGSFTTLTTSSTVTVNGGTVNTIPYLNATKVLTSGSALQFDGANIGLAVAPSVWATSNKAIQLGAQAAVYGGAVNGISISDNEYVFTGNVPRYIASDFASNISLATGQIAFRTAPSGTANTSLTWTTRGYFDSSGLTVTNGSLYVRAASTQDGVELLGRAGGTSSFKVSITPTTLTASRTLTAPDNSGTILTTGATVTVAQGGTGATTLTGVVKGNGTSAFTAGTVSLTSEVAGTLPVANGGTGATTLTGVVKGNGTSAFTAGTVSLTSEVAGTLPVANGGTGITSFGSGVATWLGTPSSANLAAAVTDETGSGSLVFATSPTLVTPNIGTPSAGNLTNTTVDGTNKVGYRNLPAVGTKTASYTLAVGDVGKYVQLSTGGSIIIPNSTFAEGDAITLFNNTTGNITITCSTTNAYIAGTDTNKTSMTLATRGVATILFISSTLCVVTGNVT